MKYDLSLIISGIRNENWQTFYHQMQKSCNRHTFEIVFCSPYELPEFFNTVDNVKFIKDLGCPSRCLQRASTLAEGEFIAIASDDGIVLDSTFSNCIDQIRESSSPEKNIIALKYTEGQNFRANLSDFSNQYWHARFHGDLRMDGIEEDWNICLMFLMSTQRFRDLGGIDCRFEHFNANLHDMAFRAQRDGSRVLISRDFVTAHDWDPSRNEHNSPILQAYFRNNKPLLQSIYSTKEAANARPIKIDYNNWQEQPEVWPRRS
jgi:hypothetical protein